MKKKSAEKISLRVLYLEDSPRDVEIIRELLVDAGYDLSMDCTDKKKEFVSLLRNRTYDVILSDFTLPGFDAYEALRLAADICPGIPFICVSGTIGEETAIEIIKKGAVDYVLKDRMVRLPSAIKRALEEAKEKEERRRAESALQKSEEIFRHFMEHSPIYVFFKDENIRAIRLSNNYETMLGKPMTELLGKTMDDLFPSELAKSMVADDMRIMKEGKEITVVEELNGRFYTTIKFPIYIEGKPRYLAGYTIDITERKRAEEKINVLARFPSENPNPVLRVEQDGKIDYANPASESLLRIWNCAVGEYLPPDWRERVVNAIGHNTSTTVEVEVEEGFYSIMVVPIPDAGYINLYGRDITERKRAELASMLAEETLRESEERYRMLVETLPDGVVVHSQGRVVFANPASAKIIGAASTAELIDKPVLEFVHPDERELALKRIQQSLSDGSPTPAAEEKFIRLDGTLVSVEVSAIPLDFAGKPAMLTVFTDITERKRVEGALQESESRFRTAFEHAAVGMSLTKTDGSFLQVNGALCTMLGYSKEELLAINFLDITHPEDRSITRDKISEAVIEQDTIPPFEKRYIRKDGKVIWTEISSSLLRDTNQQPLYFIAQTIDITERKQAEKQLRESEERMSDVIYSVGDWIWEVDENWKYTYSSQKCEELFGCTPEEVIGKTPFDFMPPEEVERVKKIYFGVIFNKALLKDLENWKFGKNGKRICLLTNGVHVLDEEGNIRGYRGVDKDITEKKLIEHARQRGEEALRSTTEFNELLLQAIPFGMEIVDEQGTILFLSQTMKNLIGRDAVGHTCWSVYKDDKKQCLDCPLRWGIEFGKPEVLESFDVLGGRIFQISHVGIMYHGKKAMLEVFVEVTEQRKLQNQFLQSQKIQSIGTLAGGIAHDFNNILGIILAYSSLLERVAGDKEKIIDSSVAISKAVGRGAALVRQILTFARQTDVSFQPLSIPDFVREVFSMLEETFPEIIEINIDIAGKIPFINADHAQMHQALLNLCVNARDAMPSGGTLNIKVITVDHSTVKKHFSEASAEQYVCISVADTGTGMDAKTKSKIFDPFFTTKEQGKGTGLGLAVVYGVMQTHHGFVDVESEVGKGTTFFLYLPVPLDPEKGQKMITSKSSDVPNGTETLLLVEDEDMLRNMTQTFLESKGYYVYTASDGMEAVEIYREHQYQIDLVLTDVGLPKMTGIEEFKKLKEINPHVKVLLSSGFFELDTKSELYKAGAKGFIQKPYKPEDMLRKIREVLDGK